MRIIKLIICLLLVLFSSLYVKAQTITVIQPNGGEILYACQVYPVKWSQSGTVSNYWNIDYSLDGGTIWASVATNFLSANGQFNWTVPSIQSNTVLLRVYDAQNALVADQSNAYFTINIPVTLTSPNGGEVWQGNTVKNITWNAAGTSNTYNIAYSLNNGSTWTTIVSNLSNTTGTYAWTVPTIALNTNCLVRVQDYVQNCMQDVSNAVFTITPAQPILSNPNGGQTFQVSCFATINWNTTTLYTTARLDYSTDNGTTWTMIINNTANDGSYTWTIPNIPSTTCLVRISNTGDLSLTDVSNSTFTIARPVTVTYPNGGETLIGCNVVGIAWTKSDCIGDWKIDYSLDGVTYTNITTVTDNGSLTQTYNWQVPNGVNVTTAKIKVGVYLSSPVVEDESNASVTIIPSNDITVTSPNGGEVWQGLSQHAITWTNLPTASGQYTLQYSTNNGFSWTTIVSNITGNSYTWTVPNIPSATCLVKVLDYVNTCKYDVSNAVFTITPAQPILSNPNGGQTFQVSCFATINWNTTTLYTTARLDYSTDNGTSWAMIINNTANDGSYTWTIPNIPSTTCLVRISNTGDLSLTDVSNSTFTIARPVTVTYPNGGETLIGCNVVGIAWTKSDCIGDWKIDYSLDGVTYTNITTVTDNGSLTQTYNWQVPNGVNVTTAKIKVGVYLSSPVVEDESNASVTIIPSNDITVTSPNGGEVWQGLSQHAITWTNLPTASGQYTLQYSTNNGFSWTTIVSNITGNSYTWTVPNIPSATCLVKVLDYVNTCKYDVSNAVFTITPAQPILSNPNGGQTFQVSCFATINWNTTTLYTTARLDYSTDNGTTWAMIINNTANDGSYTWTIPNIPSTTCLVRISNTGDLSLTDVSNSTFTIARPVTVTYPNGGETLIGCNVVGIAWTKSDCIGDWKIDYSLDGVTYTNITTVTDNGSLTQTYNWQVPNGVNVTTAKIKVGVYLSSPVVEDESNASVTIIPSNDITVTSPNGGEVWQGLSQHAITWTNLPTASGQYTLQYSTNNGFSWTTIVSNITGNSYTWTVPNIPSATCLVKVLDYVNTCKYDVSNAVFTITPAQPILSNPNGGQTFQVSCFATINWNTTTLYTTARLDYSTDNGTTWAMIINNTANDGSYTWTIPNIPSTTCLVRISNTGDLSLTDVSNSTFTIARPVTVTYPNGGETLIGCNVVGIAWTKSDCIGDWKIDYSLDGVTYTNITTVTDNGSLTQTYNWQVPNGVNVTTAKIKVGVYLSSPVVEDESNASVTIIPSNDITVTSPNGGEVWQGLSQHAITWTNLPTASGQYTLQYSTNNGFNWTTIVSNITGNSYTWTVPNIPSATCLVKVLDYVNTCKYDVSNAVFTITPAQPILSNPNGGQTFQVSCFATINWNTTTLYTTARLDYSTDNGTTWAMIINNTANDGSYTWTIPNIPSTTCLVRISNTGDLSLTDVSNSTFTIARPVTVTYPNGGETLIGCNVVGIAWTKSDCIGDWKIDYSLDGVTYTNITTVTDNGSLTQTYNWQVPNGVNVTTAKIKVGVYLSSPVVEDESNASVTIIPSNDITVTSPNGGEVWQGLSQQAITWTNLPTASGQYTLQYSTNNGFSWTTIVSNITGNSYTWTVPNIPSATCLVKVLDYVNTCKYDVSNAVFTITPAQPILANPNGGQILYSGTLYNITWNTTTLYTTARIDYSMDNGATWTMIINNTANDGSYTWTIPNVFSTTALVRISNTNDLSVWDVSNAVFTLRPAVTIIAPNGDTQVDLGGCTVSSITFDRSSAWSSYLIEYSLNNGVTWTTIVNNWTAATNPATYNWNIPNINTTQALVRVTPVSTSFSDVSDYKFDIIKAVTIIQPNFGGIMQAGTTYDIMWASDGISNIYDLFYSTNGGTSFTNIVTGYNTSNNKYTWTVPNIPSTNCRIMIRDNVNTCKTDTSDMAFIISATAAPITLTKPNGISDTVSACTTYTITWSDAPAIGSYNIAYSLNSGATWVEIVSNYSTVNQSYDWAVPDGIASSTVLLKISSSANPAIYDLSDAFFVIKQLTYTFTGTGNWDNPSNWVNNLVPPATAPACSQIIIDPQAGGECVLNVIQTMPSGTRLTVKDGKKFRVPGNINLQ